MMQKIVNTTSGISGILPLLSRIVGGIVAAAWYAIQPSLSFFYICVFAVAVDCVTAWRLNRRIRRTYSAKVADGKLKSSHMSKMITDLAVVFLCIVLAYQIDNTILAHLGNLHLSSYVAAVFCGVEIVSILENESSCNGKSWAKVLQQFLQDKTKRHLSVDEETFENIKRILAEKRDLGNQGSVENHDAENQNGDK